MKIINQRNPILPLEHHVPDSEAHVMPDGKLYIYGSYDLLDEVFCSGEYHAVWTQDMKTWEICDQPSLLGTQIPWYNDPDAVRYPGIDWSNPTPFIKKMLAEHPQDKESFETEEDGPKPPLLFAPDCMEKDGTYYLYFCMQDDSEGVVKADNPAGPFSDPVQLPCGGIDPAIFIDDDGQPYYYWGQLFSHGVKMNQDMCSFDRDGIVDDLVTEEEHFFHEGSSMRKIGDTYYYVYADMERGKPTALGYSTGKSPLGPFTYRGIIVDNDHCDPSSWNNHGSIECFNGQWYVFYHRCSRGKQQYRRLCIEKIEVLPDGSIPEVRMTSQGVGDPFAPGETIMGHQACEVHGGCYIDTDPEYGEVLTELTAGSKAVFRYVASDKKWSGIRVRAKGTGEIKVHMNPHKKTADNSICTDAYDQPAGSGAQTIIIGNDSDIILSDGYKEYKSTLEYPSGEYELVLEVKRGTDLKIAEITLY